MEPIVLTTEDGETLAGEWAEPTGPGPARAVCVLCHPHPQAGGTMRSLVVSALFTALPAAGVATLRFNFRGVEDSSGSWDAGDAEQGDVRAAIAAAGARTPNGPLLLAGWSFGADMALSVRDAAIAGWFAIAPPLRYTSDAALAGIAADPRPKLLALAEHDEVRSATEVAAIASGWTATDVETIGGASHFFVGRTDRLVDLAIGQVDALVR